MPCVLPLPPAMFGQAVHNRTHEESCSEVWKNPYLCGIMTINTPCGFRSGFVTDEFLAKGVCC